MKKGQVLDNLFMLATAIVMFGSLLVIACIVY